jgi:hypothetical protein
VPPVPANAAYFRLWYWRIAQHVAPYGTRVFIASLPRGPFHARFGAPRQPSLQAIGLDRGIGVELLDAPDLATLERPAFYFDGLHLNADGRLRYTDLLANQVAAALATPPPGGAAP